MGKVRNMVTREARLEWGGQARGSCPGAAHGGSVRPWKSLRLRVAYHGVQAETGRVDRPACSYRQTHSHGTGGVRQSTVARSNWRPLVANYVKHGHGLRPGHVATLTDRKPGFCNGLQYTSH